MTIDVVFFLLVLLAALVAMGYFTHGLINRRPWAIRMAAAMALANAATSRHLHDDDYLRQLARDFDGRSKDQASSAARDPRPSLGQLPDGRVSSEGSSWVKV